MYSIYCNPKSGPCAGNIACEGPNLETIYNRNMTRFNNCFENESEIPITSDNIKLNDIEVFELMIS